MIPPAAIHSMGLAMARLAGWGVARLVSAGVDRTDFEIRRLSKLDEPALLMEIAFKDNAAVVLTKPDDVIQSGQATVQRLLPQARALICPHRSTLITLVNSPEVTVISAVVGYLMGGLPGALVIPVATLLVKRGIQSLCSNSSLSATAVAR